MTTESMRQGGRWIELPEHWRRLSLDGKRRWLIDRHYARDWYEASSLLARFRRRRKAGI